MSEKSVSKPWSFPRDDAFEEGVVGLYRFETDMDRDRAKEAIAVAMLRLGRDRDRMARIIAPRAFRTVEERLGEWDDWLGRMKVAIEEDPRVGEGFDPEAQAFKYALDSYEEDSSNREEALKKADEINALRDGVK